MGAIGRILGTHCLVGVLCLATAPAHAQTPSPAATPQPSAASDENDDGQLDERPKKRSQKDDLPGWHYASRGLQFRSSEGRFFQWFTFRNQFRVSSPFDGTPTEPEDIPVDGEGNTELVVNRSRVKFGGHLGTPRVQNFVEIDVKNQRMYHFFVTVQANRWLDVRVGQWKVEFNRERVDSSGDQQFVDRSIVNNDFTLDGQWGAMARGRLFRGHAADSSYFLGVFAGEGRLTTNDDSTPMVLGRYQWNLLRRSVGFSQSDVEYSPEAAATIGIAAVRGRGRHTRYDSSGGANLDGFSTGEPGQYELRQWMVDFAFFRRGFSAQGEQHSKKVIDHLQGGQLTLHGGYLQAGFFPVRGWSRALSSLELAGRLAYVDPDAAVDGRNRQEYSGAINWYFNQHRNKTSFDISRLVVESTAGLRIRLQWDLSL